ncbi:MAG: stage II sporulation protein P [Ruminococcaceae bacterium]|nr:stage II sporulation protein P [Oscillospiraceae bacterium]
MKKQLFIMFLNIISIFGCVGICFNVFPSFLPQVTDASVVFAKLASPEYLGNKAGANISNYITPEAENTTNTRDGEQVMHTIGSKESDDDCDITETPSDVKTLMKEAEKKYSKKNSKGKTSEEPYQGGGTIISCGDVQIQSKIPSSYYKPNIKALLKQGSDLKIKDKSKPTILIYHSHTTEAYSLLDSGYYISSDSRSKDNSKNVVRVGDELVKYLEKAGFVVIHDTKIHDTDYNTSYDSSRKVVEKYLEEYPSIEITIDLHRDDITYSNKTKVKPTAVVNDKKAARMMIISGCEYGRVVNFPDWEYNLRFDLQVQNKVCKLYPGLMRPILFSERKYNMYETHTSFLLEIGTDANTLDEACYSARLFGDALGKLLNDKYVKQ